MREKLNLLKVLASNLSNNIVSYIKSNHNFEYNEKQVYFYLRDYRNEPYYYPILFFFKQRGFRIFLKVNMEFLANTFGCLSEIFRWKNLRLSTPNRKEDCLLITDDELFFNNYSTDKRILLKRFKFDEMKNNLLPFPMHPNIYSKGLYREVKDIREKERSIRIIFSGNTAESAYSNKIFKEYFKILNRIEIIDSIISELGPNELFVVRNQQDLDAISNTDCTSKAVVYIWKWTNSFATGMEIKVKVNEWLHFLGSADFFLCCPGVIIPHSHNAIEAMSVGTIPILQYGKWMNPVLVHGENCIYFTDEDDLIRKIKDIVVMDPKQIKKIRNNVINYYEKYLSYTNDSILRFLNEQELYYYSEVIF